MSLILFSIFVFLSVPMESTAFFWSKKTFMDEFGHVKHSIAKPQEYEAIKEQWPDLVQKQRNLENDKNHVMPCAKCIFERYLQVLAIRYQYMGEAARTYTPGNVKELIYITKGESPKKLAEYSKEELEELAELYIVYHKIITGKMHVEYSEFDQQQLKQECAQQYILLRVEEAIQDRIYR